MLIDYRLSGVATRRITQLLAYAVGDGSDHKLSHILQSMYSDAPAKLFVWIEDDREAVGLIGWRVQGGSLEILHVAVDEGKRHQGIGRRLIDAAVALGCLGGGGCGCLSGERGRTVAAEPRSMGGVGHHGPFGRVRVVCRMVEPGTVDGSGAPGLDYVAGRTD